MDRILPAANPLPLFDAASSRKIEAEANEAVRLAAAPRLMVRAGIAVARLGAAIAPFCDRVWVAAGPGNNGGDGIEAAIHLHRQGRLVTLTLVGDKSRLPADAAISLQSATQAGLTVGAATDAPPPLGACDLVIDALLGLGSSRAPEGPIAGCVDLINAQRCTILAVDLPTGLDADTGRLLGACAVRASATLSLLTLKPGLFTGMGREVAGRIWLDSLGVATTNRQPDAWLSGCSAHHAGYRRHGQHKGSFGDIVIVAGAPGMAGAALLCARSAHAAGAGRIWVAPLDSLMPLLDITRPELMWIRDTSELGPDSLGRMTVVAGCGGGTVIARQLSGLLRTAARLVLDADGLNAIAADPVLQHELRNRSDRDLPTIITPHPLEAARLLGVPTSKVQDDRPRAARELADRFGVVTVLKGSGTVIAAPGATPRINSSGGPALATAGSGDVFAGWLGGQWSAVASGTSEPEITALDVAFDVASHAVWWHGAAADAKGLPLLRAGDLIDAMAGFSTDP